MSQRSARQRQFLEVIKTRLEKHWNAPGMVAAYPDDEDRNTLRELAYVLEAAFEWCFAGKTPPVNTGSFTPLENFVTNSLNQSKASDQELKHLRERNAELERLVISGGGDKRKAHWWSRR